MGPRQLEPHSMRNTTADFASGSSLAILLIPEKVEKLDMRDKAIQPGRRMSKNLCDSYQRNLSLNHDACDHKHCPLQASSTGRRLAQ